MEKRLKKLLREERGITLVALIITVILMLILAGVAISAVIDSEGLFGKTREATKAYEDAAKDENKTISNLMNYIDKYVSENLGGNNKIEKVDTSKEISNLGIQVVADSSTQITITTTVETSENYEGTLTYEYYINNEKVEETTEPTKVISDLTPNTFYTVYVIVRDEDGGVKYSQDITIKTKERVYLYKEGDECIEITGGWKKTGYHVANSGTFTKNEDSMYMRAPTGSRIYVGTTLQIDFSEYDAIGGELTVSSGIISVMASNKASYSNQDYNTGTYYGLGAFNNNVLWKDLSSVNSSYYLHLTVSPGNATIKNIWLEK